MSRRNVPPVLPPMSASRSPRHVWERCCLGVEPAESLHPRDREDLVATLVERGWTDVEIAVLTRMTTYTAARIRDRLGLPANRPRRVDLEAVA